MTKDKEEKIRLAIARKRERTKKGCNAKDRKWKLGNTRIRKCKDD
jgi:hypothetical protein